MQAQSQLDTEIIDALTDEKKSVRKNSIGKSDLKPSAAARESGTCKAAIGVTASFVVESNRDAPAGGWLLIEISIDHSHISLTD